MAGFMRLVGWFVRVMAVLGVLMGLALALNRSWGGALSMVIMGLVAWSISRTLLRGPQSGTRSAAAGDDGSEAPIDFTPPFEPPSYEAPGPRDDGPRGFEP